MEYIAAYISVGIIVGFICGLFGIGGATIIIPTLIWVYTLQGINHALIMHMAAGTSMAILTFTSAASLFGHEKYDVHVLPIYKQLVAGVIIGTIFGSILGHFIHGDVLKILFGFFILFTSLQMIIAKEQSKATEVEILSNKKLTAFMSFVIGSIAGILGIGCASISIVFLGYCNVSLRNIIAISTALGLTIGIFGTISYMSVGSYSSGLPVHSTGYIYWPACLWIAGGALIFSQIGVSLSHKLPIQKLKKVLGCVLFLIALHILIGDHISKIISCYKI